jgi:xanthine dehydrogenase YagT iron-sulfur-binding subunit
MRFSINGAEHDLETDLRMLLLDLLRERLHLTGAKKGRDQSACGACTILADGERINACLALAIQFQERAIITIEGVGAPDRLHPLQAAFVEHDGFQCGYCTPASMALSVTTRCAA